MTKSITLFLLSLACLSHLLAQNTSFEERKLGTWPPKSNSDFIDFSKTGKMVLYVGSDDTGNFVMMNDEKGIHIRTST